MGILDHISNLCYIAKGEYGLKGMIQYACSLVHNDAKARAEKQHRAPENSRNLEAIAQYTH
ncbi:hypothetical protein J4482_00380 [Candidatus Woesearchaeota archaeon]|nr:hypothetical protein [Candidatus Woesearchaeota archaeon]